VHVIPVYVFVSAGPWRMLTFQKCPQLAKAFTTLRYLNVHPIDLEQGLVHPSQDLHFGAAHFDSDPDLLGEKKIREFFFSKKCSGDNFSKVGIEN
jgi:hypothetical protein